MLLAILLLLLVLFFSFIYFSHFHLFLLLFSFFSVTFFFTILHKRMALRSSVNYVILRWALFCSCLRLSLVVRHPTQGKVALSWSKEKDRTDVELRRGTTEELLWLEVWSMMVQASRLSFSATLRIEQPQSETLAFQREIIIIL